MEQLLIMILPAIVIVSSIFIVVYPSIWLSKLRRRGRRSPLTTDLLRAPGESLRQLIDDLSSDITGYLAASFAVPLAFSTSILSQLYFTKIQTPQPILAAYGFVAFIFLAFSILKMSNAMTRRNQLRVALDAEVAVGQELNQLMLHGYRVYHDFPCDGFNIDHILFGPNGVFAVETKGKAKPAKGSTKQEWKVAFDGQALQFPNWTERDFLPQARRQAEWLAKWLTSAVGEQVQVKPVLAIPGWYIDRLKPSDVFLFNGKNPLAWAGIKSATPLSDSLIQRIAHQVEQKCRDVAPSGYKEEKKTLK